MAIESSLGIAYSWLNNTTFDDNEKEKVLSIISSIRNMASDIARSDYPSVSIGAYAVAGVIKGFGIEIPIKVTRFVTFATAMAEVENGDQAAQVLTNYAAPVGSWKIKRRKKAWYFTLNGYLGAGYGGGFLGTEEKVEGISGNVYGAVAPIGLEFGRGGIPGKFSFGVLVSAVDLGSVASFRDKTEDDNIQSQPNVGFQQVFSPGIYGILGLWDWPLSLGFGRSIAPELRMKEDGKKMNAIRTIFFLAVDIPIISF